MCVCARNTEYYYLLKMNMHIWYNMVIDLISIFPKFYSYFIHNTSTRIKNHSNSYDCTYCSIVLKINTVGTQLKQYA